MNSSSSYSPLFKTSSNNDLKTAKPEDFSTIGVKISGTYFDAISIANISRQWLERAGVESPLELYNSLLSYERKTGKKTSEVIEQWKSGTLQRTPEINDWINTYFILQGYRY